MTQDQSIEIFDLMVTIWKASSPEDPKTVNEYLKYFMPYNFNQVHEIINRLRLTETYFPVIAKIHEFLKNNIQMQGNGVKKLCECKYCHGRGLVEYWEILEGLSFQKFSACVCRNASKFPANVKPITAIVKISFLDKLKENDIVYIDKGMLKIQSRPTFPAKCINDLKQFLIGNRDKNFLDGMKEILNNNPALPF